jgi:serine/threonine-protein kinase
LATPSGSEWYNHDSVADPEQFGRYRLLERIAVGGMGEVYLARYLSAAGIERHAVVKRILPHLNKDPNFVAHFLTEGRITSLLAHPNVVQTIELGRVADQYYIALEYIPGVTLVRLLANAMKLRRRLSIPLIHHLSIQVARALEYIHNLTNLEGDPLEIIHMDLAPHNVLVTPDGQAKLLDFGISQAHGLGTDTDARRDFRGRTAYLAPEQLDGLKLDKRVDLFALGIMMHEMVLARPLFRARVEQQTATRILYAPIPRMRTQRPDCPEALENIVIKALQRARSHRYQDASEVLRDLDHCAQKHNIVHSSGRFREELGQLVEVSGEIDIDGATTVSPGEVFEPMASTTLE